MSICTKRRITSTLLALVFTLTFGLAAVQPGKAYTALETVGVVDYVYLLNNHPDMAKGNEAFTAEQEQARKDFKAKAVNLSGKEKQDLSLQLNQRVEQKRQNC